MTNQAINKTIDHWERMLTWVKKQKKSNGIDMYLIEEKIGESWTAKDCVLCLKYFRSCFDCPLFKKYNKTCSRLGWEKIDRSKTWGEWILNAKKFLKRLKGLRSKL